MFIVIGAWWGNSKLILGITKIIRRNNIAALYKQNIRTFSLSSRSRRSYKKECICKSSFLQSPLSNQTITSYPHLFGLDFSAGLIFYYFAISVATILLEGFWLLLCVFHFLRLLFFVKCNFTPFHTNKKKHISFPKINSSEKLWYQLITVLLEE